MHTLSTAPVPLPHTGAQLELLSAEASLAESREWGGSTDFAKRMLRIAAPDRATLDHACELVRGSVLVPLVFGTDQLTQSPASMVKTEADSKRNQASEDPEATKRITSAVRAPEARKAIEADQRMAARFPHSDGFPTADQRMAPAEREMAAPKPPAAVGKPSSPTFQIGKPSSSTFHDGQPSSSTFHDGQPSSSTFQPVVGTPEIERQVERTIQALKKSSFQNGKPSAYFSTPEMYIKYNTSGDLFTVKVYSVPEGKRESQCETILMNERQVAQSLTTLAAPLAARGTNLESLVYSESYM